MVHVCSHAACDCPDRICCIKVDVGQRSKKYLTEIYGLILDVEKTYGRWGRWNIILEVKKGVQHRVFLHKNDKVETDDKYLFNREEMLEWVLMFYAT